MSFDEQSIFDALKQIVRDLDKDASYEPKYGGQMIVPANADESIGGIFGYKAHVSLEFSQGASLEDADGYLEGKGKHRRHLKFEAVRDVEDKNTKAYLKQAFKA